MRARVSELRTSFDAPEMLSRDGPLRMISIVYTQQQRTYSAL